jgi:MoxR-like ATPase
MHATATPTATAKQRENKSRDAANPKIRVPAELRDRIDGLADELRESYSAGRCELPAGVDPDNIPRWAIILKALDELEGHRARSRKSRSNKKTPKS